METEYVLHISCTVDFFIGSYSKTARQPTMSCSKCNKHISHLFSYFQRDPEKLARRRDEKRARSHVLKEKILKMIESGLQLSEYQSRKAFSVYLHCILQRLTDFDPDAGQGSNQQVRTRRSIISC